MPGEPQLAEWALQTLRPLNPFQETHEVNNDLHDNTVAIFAFSSVVTLALKAQGVVDGAAGPYWTHTEAVAPGSTRVIVLFTITLEGRGKRPVLLKNVLEEAVKMVNLL